MIVVWEAGDRIGNRLFISAYGIALAQTTGQRLINLHLDKYEDLFPATKPSFWPGFLRFPLYSFFRQLIRKLSRSGLFQQWFVRFAPDGANSAACSPVNPDFVSERKGKLFTFIMGWPFLEHMSFPDTDVIRKVFNPPQALLKEAWEHAQVAKGNAKILVGVHIRHGDYKNHLNGKYFYSFEQYKNIMIEVQSLFDGEVSFLVCSDAQPTVKDFDGLKVTLGPGTLLGDVYSLSFCDYLIGTPSTFCLWAAFYGRVPLYMLARAVAPQNLAAFVIPDGNFECMKTIMDNPVDVRVVAENSK